MRAIYCCILLFLIRTLPLINSLVTDELCYSHHSSSLLAKTAHSDPQFHQSLEKLSKRPFSLVVRYCLGKDGESTSQNFVECVNSMSTCPKAWYSTMNWQFCFCNTAHCIFKNCIQHWLETFNFADTKCFGRCLTDSFSCIAKQSGKTTF